MALRSRMDCTILGKGLSELLRGARGGSHVFVFRRGWRTIDILTVMKRASGLEKGKLQTA